MSSNNLTLDQINREFESFYEFCKENHLNDDDVRKICEPLLKPVRRAKLVKHLKICIFSMFVLLLLYVVCSTEQVSWHLSAIGRIFMIKLLPFYDWTQLRNENCLIKRTNSKMEQRFDCVLCEAVDEIEVFDVNAIDRDAIYEYYIKLHVPLAVTRATAPWKIHSLPISNFTEMLRNNEIIAESYPCKLSTNLHRGDAQLANVLTKTSHFSSYFIHFQNCEWEAVKQFRMFAPRPAFLHPQIAPIQYSWVLLNRNYNVAKFKRVELKENIAIVGQVLGRTRFRLKPQVECEFECYVLEVELGEGEVLLLTSLWNLEYKPVAEGENVAVILETH